MSRKKNCKNKKIKSNKKIFGSIITFVIIAAILFGIQFLQFADSYSSSGPKAVIVDQLSQSLPNKTFINTATSILNNANYSVDYIPSDDVTVQFYKNLANKNYDIIILRVHSTIGKKSEKSIFILFTSEIYSQDKYQYEQITDKVCHVKTDENSKSYFGISPDFVKYNMKGEFDKTIVIMMGCGGTVYPKMYESFFEKGASGYVGWDERVDIRHTDKATINLLNHILINNETLEIATEKTNKEIGLDPTYKSKLCFYISEN